jgi:hypothetical protein
VFVGNPKKKGALMRENIPKHKVFEIKLGKEKTQTVSNRNRNFTFGGNKLQNNLKNKSDESKKREEIKDLKTNSYKNKEVEVEPTQSSMSNRVHDKEMVLQNLYSLQASNKKKQIFMQTANNIRQNQNLFMKKNSVQKEVKIDIYNQMKEKKNLNEKHKVGVKKQEKVSPGLMHTTSLPLTSNHASRTHLNFSKNNSKREITTYQPTQPDPTFIKKERPNSQFKLKKIVSSEADLHTKTIPIKKAPKFSNQFLSKQTTLNDVHSQLKQNQQITGKRELTKTKSFTKFVDYFGGSSSQIDNRKHQKNQRNTSIAKNQKEKNCFTQKNKNVLPKETLLFNKTQPIFNGNLSFRV